MQTIPNLSATQAIDLAQNLSNTSGFYRTRISITPSSGQSYEGANLTATFPNNVTNAYMKNILLFGNPVYAPLTGGMNTQPVGFMLNERVHLINRKGYDSVISTAP